ncbi:hypothetical protein L1049_011350 [Liquidambar formosana]|uniref:Sororin C-terminal region domain-containing protein n=1 Tax=Liquidambar formosana TaxID=63359 RepID=A0AAP0WWZ0_LIQFO
MEAERRSLKRKPLSDCTNTTTTPRKSTSSSSSTTTSFLKPTKPSLSTTKKPEKKSDNNAQNPSSLPPHPSTPLRPSNPAPTPTGTGEPLTVYSRRQNAEKRKNKGKMVAIPLSCPSLEKIKNIREKLNKVGDVGLSKSCTVPRKKKRSHLPIEEDVSKNALPQDFIDQQRAYFAEIDSFELPVEVASDSELD